MAYILDLETDVDIEATGTNLILQNISNILRTMQGEVALDRKLGIDSSLIDRPVLKVQAKFMKDFLYQIESIFDNVTVKFISFDSDINGIYPKVEVEINE